MLTFTPSELAAIGQWLASHHTGVSSKTMLAIALGANMGDFDAPYDEGDFLRCYRLVKIVPRIVDAFDRIGELCPPFAGILREWPELVRMHERAKRSDWNDQTLLYKRIRELRKATP